MAVDGAKGLHALDTNAGAGAATSENRSLRKKVREPKAESERVIRKVWVWERIKAKGT